MVVFMRGEWANRVAGENVEGAAKGPSRARGR
jgi:hypothetical protein